MSIEKQILENQALFEKILSDNLFKNKESINIFNKIIKAEKSKEVSIIKEKVEISNHLKYFGM